MISTVSAKTESAELSASIILDRLTIEMRNVERTAIRRGLLEAIRAWPGEESEQWWRWVEEAATSLGLYGRPIDCSRSELGDIVRNGARLVIREPESGEWFAVLGAKKKHLLVLRPAVAPKPRWTKRGEFLKNFRSEPVRCVAFNPFPLAIRGGKGELTPFERLRLLLRPEWSDIWIVILFAFVVGLLTLATPVAVEALVNSVAFGRFLQPVIVLALILFVFLAFSGALRALQAYVAEVVQRRLFARVAGDLAFRLPRLNAKAANGEYVPELVNRFFDVVLVQKICAQLLLDGVGLILSTLIGMAVLGFYHPWLLGFDLFLLACFTIIVVVLGRGAIPTAIKESKTKYRMAAWLEDLARCPTTFRSAGGTDLALERTDRLVHEYLSARRTHFSILMRQIVFALTLQAVASTVLLGLGGWLVISFELTLGQLVAAELIVTVIVAAFTKLGKHLEGFYDLLAAVDKLGVLFDLPVEEQGGILTNPASGPCGIIIESVSAGHAIRDLSIKIEPRDTVAFYGRSGSGKSLIGDLLYGTRAPSKGAVFVDNIDPRDFRPDILRERVTLVAGPEVFTGTIDENIHMHRPAVMPTAVHRALDVVGLQPFVVSLPDGAETELTSSGAPFSEAQIRMLAIARAIAGGPGLIVVDGTLDALPDDDLETVLKALIGDHRMWTTIILTGRRSIAERLERSVPLHTKNVLIGKD